MSMILGLRERLCPANDGFTYGHNSPAHARHPQDVHACQDALEGRKLSLTTAAYATCWAVFWTALMPLASSCTTGGAATSGAGAVATAGHARQAC